MVRDPRTSLWADSKAIAGVALGYQFPDSEGLKAAEFSGGEATVRKQLQWLGFEVAKLGEVGGSDWRHDEVAAIVEDYLAMLVSELAGQAFNNAVAPAVHDFSRVRAETPRRANEARERESRYGRSPIQRDYLAREAQNRSLGLAGEEFALRFERWRLVQSGAGQLAERVEHVSATRGDGLGYDIESFETDGQPRYIEVKTTSFGDRTPFFVSSNELSFSRASAERFRLYRLFDFRAAPRLFEIAGPIDRHCLLDPTSYRASFD